MCPILCITSAQRPLKNDYFAAADNGAGYIMPGMLQEPRESGLPSGLETWGKHCKSIIRNGDCRLPVLLLMDMHQD